MTVNQDLVYCVLVHCHINSCYREVTYLVELYSVFQLLYGSQEGYIQLSVTGVNVTVNLPGRAVLSVPLAV